MRLKAGTTRFKVGSSSRALWLACLLLFMPAAYAETVKIGIEPRAPLFELGQDGAPTGLYVDLLQDFVERHNWDVLFIDGQTPDLLQQLREQNLDMVVGVDADNVVGDGLELLEPALFTQWIQVYRPFPSLWQRWTEARWDNLQDLSEKRLGVVAKSPAYQHTQKICKLLPTSCNLALFESMSQLLAALRNEKIDAIVVDTLAASYHQLNFHANPSALIFAPAPINIAIAKNTVASKRNELRDMLAFWQRDRPPEYEQIVWHSYPQRAQKPQILPAQHLVIGLGIGFLIGLIGILLVIRNHKSKPIIVTKEDLDHESRRYQVLINSIPYGLQEIDTKGRILFSNAAEHQMRRYKFGELQGHSIFDMMAFEREKKALREYFKRILKQQPEPEHYYCTITRKDGEMAELRVEWSYKRDPHGNITGFFGLVSDVTETEQTKYRIVEQQKTMTQVVQKRTEDLKEAYNDLLMAATVFEYTDQGILVLKPNNLVESANPAFLRQSGYTEDELPNLTLKSFSAERHGPKFHASLEARLKDKTFWQGEFWLARRNGKVYPTWVSINAVLDAQENIKQYVALFTDISRLKKAEQQIWRQAHYDTLTNLPNRNLFYQRLSQTVENKKQRAAVMFIDLDRFKQVNDTLGHDAGDELLKKVSTRLQKCLSKDDMVARMGGDEFTVIMTKAQDIKHIEKVAQNILKVLATPFKLTAQTVNISGSVGIAIFPDQGDNMIALLKHADIAMYQAKEGGRDGFRIFQS